MLFVLIQGWATTTMCNKINKTLENTYYDVIFEREKAILSL